VLPGQSLFPTPATPTPTLGAGASPTSTTGTGATSTPTATATRTPTPSSTPTGVSATPGSPFGIAVGSDGNLWFTDPARNSIGRITTSGFITLFPLTTINGI